MLVLLSSLFKTCSSNLFEKSFQVEVMSKSERASKAETAFKLFDKNRDGFITREEFTQVSIFFRTNEKQGYKSKHLWGGCHYHV